MLCRIGDAGCSPYDGSESKPAVSNFSGTVALPQSWLSERPPSRTHADGLPPPPIVRVLTSPPPRSPLRSDGLPSPPVLRFAASPPLLPGFPALRPTAEPGFDPSTPPEKLVELEQETESENIWDTLIPVSPGVLPTANPSIGVEAKLDLFKQSTHPGPVDLERTLEKVKDSLIFMSPKVSPKAGPSTSVVTEVDLLEPFSQIAEITEDNLASIPSEDTVYESSEGSFLTPSPPASPLLESQLGSPFMDPHSSAPPSPEMQSSSTSYRSGDSGSSGEWVHPVIAEDKGENKIYGRTATVWANYSKKQRETSEFQPGAKPRMSSAPKRPTQRRTLVQSVTTKPPLAKISRNDMGSSSSESDSGGSIESDGTVDTLEKSLIALGLTKPRVSNEKTQAHKPQEEGKGKEKPNVQAAKELKIPSLDYFKKHTPDNNSVKTSIADKKFVEKNTTPESIFKKIRRVVVRQIPPYTPLWIFIARVRGGNIDYVIYDKNKGYAKIVFVEHEAALSFWEHTKKNGFYIGTLDEETGELGPPWTEACVEDFCSKTLEGVREIHTKADFGVASRVILLTNVPKALHITTIKDEIFKGVFTTGHRPARIDELFEDMFHLRDRAEKIEYWPVANRNISLDQPETLTDTNEPELWTEMGGNAVVFALSSIKLAFTAICRLRNLPAYEGIQFGFVGDHCNDSLGSLKLLTQKEKAAAKKFAPSAMSPVSTVIPTMNHVIAAGSGYTTVKTNEVAVYLSGVSLDMTEARLTPYVRGGKLFSIKILPSAFGGKGADALILFATTQAADKYVRYISQRPMYIEGIIIGILNYMPEAVRGRMPTNVRVFQDRTRVISLEGLGLHFHDSNSVRDLVNSTVGWCPYYASINVAPGLAVLTFCQMEHASDVFGKLLVAKRISNEWRHVSIQYYKDPCAGPLEEIRRERI